MNTCDDDADSSRDEVIDGVATLHDEMSSVSEHDNFDDDILNAGSIVDRLPFEKYISPIKGK